MIVLLCPVHIISGDLILHKRTLGPIKSLIYAIRRYDVDRVAALHDLGEQPEGWKIEGYMSNKAKTYLADVHDHMEYILTSIEMFAGISENLIEYSFNVSFLVFFFRLMNAEGGLMLMSSYIDVITRDERGDEDFDCGHCPICAVDGSCWLLRAFHTILWCSSCILNNGAPAQGMNFDLMWSVHGRSDILYVDSKIRAERRPRFATKY